MSEEIIREYKQGRKKNFFLRENNGIYFLEKITKACGFTVKAGTDKAEKFVATLRSMISDMDQMNAARCSDDEE